MKTNNLQLHTPLLPSVLRQGDPRKKIAMSLFLLLMVLSGLYIFFLGSTTMYIGERKHVQSEIRLAHSRIADLESEFFAVSDQFDSSFAAEKGYTEAQDIAYVERDTNPEVVAFRIVQ